MLVNWLPWSVLNISGDPKRVSASSKALMQKFRLRRDRQAPSQNPTAELVEDGDEVDEAERHRDVGNVGGPDLVRPRHRQLAEQIGLDLVPRCQLRDVRPPVDRLDRHLLHQRGNMQAADLDALGGKQVAQHPAAREWEVHVQLIEPPHDGEVGNRD